MRRARPDGRSRIEIRACPIGEMPPRCSKPVDDFEVDRAAADDVVIILKPCGWRPIRSERRYKKFMEIVKGAEGF